jgi:hypothetical protein
MIMSQLQPPSILGTYLPKTNDNVALPSPTRSSTSPVSNKLLHQNYICISLVSNPCHTSTPQLSLTFPYSNNTRSAVQPWRSLFRNIPKTCSVTSTFLHSNIHLSIVFSILVNYSNTQCFTPTQNKWQSYCFVYRTFQCFGTTISEMNNKLCCSRINFHFMALC